MFQQQVDVFTTEAYSVVALVSTLGSSALRCGIRFSLHL